MESVKRSAPSLARRRHVGFRVEEEVAADFHRLCEALGTDVSTRLRELVGDDLANQRETLDAWKERHPDEDSVRDESYDRPEHAPGSLWQKIATASPGANPPSEEAA